MTISAPFFATVRKSLFGGSLSQHQVDGLNVISTQWDKDGDGDKRKLAYVLGTIFHETAKTMQPIKEFGEGKGHEYGKVDETGKAPFGRGAVQLTWRRNYVMADAKLGLNGALAKNYDLAMDPKISAEIAIKGMLEGWFTGKKLGDYIHGPTADYVDARKIINGLDRADLIAGYAQKFLAALNMPINGETA